MAIRRKNQSTWLVMCYIVLLSVSIIVTGKCLGILNLNLQIRSIISKGINYDEFRNIRIDKEKLDKIRDNVNYILKSNTEYKGHPYIDEIGYLTYAMMLSDYDMLRGTVPSIKVFLGGIGRISCTITFQELYRNYKAIFNDIKYFPVPYMGKGAHKISYEDTWYAPRSYGGDRGHEGTDLMAGNNKSGYFPILSITDGLVENIGWLEQGGYRIGIRSESNAYFYYAHLDTYAPELKSGDLVIAGQLLGFMGDSGYGQEGTKGQFDVHLHLGIYVSTKDWEMSVNPYCILKILEHSRTELLH